MNVGKKCVVQERLVDYISVSRAQHLPKLIFRFILVPHVRIQRVVEA